MSAHTFPENWNEIIAGLPGASLLQTSQWAEVKARMGWDAFPKLWKKADGTVEAAALILRRPIDMGPLHSGMSFLYVPRGPLMDWDDDELRERVLADLTAFGREQKALFIKIDPDVPVSFGEPGSEEFRENPAGQKLLAAYQAHGWINSPQQIQFANSVWINTEPSLDELLAGMKQRTRYKVRLAEKKGVTVRRGGPAEKQGKHRPGVHLQRAADRLGICAGYRQADSRGGAENRAGYQRHGRANRPGSSGSLYRCDEYRSEVL